MLGFLIVSVYCFIPSTVGELWKILSPPISQWEMATYRHWIVSLWQDPDNVPHCRILSPDKTEWLISATLCGWRRCFVADHVMVHDTYTRRSGWENVFSDKCKCGPVDVMLWDIVRWQLMSVCVCHLLIVVVQWLVVMCGKLKFSSYSFFKNRTIQNIDICLDGFSIETACNPPFR